MSHKNGAAPATECTVREGQKVALGTRDASSPQPSTSQDHLPHAATLAEHAAAIKGLCKRAVGDMIEIGERLAECKRICGHGNWLPWLEREFGMSEDTAENYMRLAKLDKFRTVRNLDLPLKALYLLAAPSTPPEVRDELLERARTEPVPIAEVKETIATAKGKKPRNFPHADLFRRMKLGDETVDKLKDTSLGLARELDRLVYLNRGASEGEHTDTVKQLVADAVAGKKVTAFAPDYRGVPDSAEVRRAITPKPPAPPSVEPRSVEHPASQDRRLTVDEVIFVVCARMADQVRNILRCIPPEEHERLFAEIDAMLDRVWDENAGEAEP